LGLEIRDSFLNFDDLLDLDLNLGIKKQKRETIRRAMHVKSIKVEEVDDVARTETFGQIID
jgi:hypothetical protein